MTSPQEKYSIIKIQIGTVHEIRSKCAQMGLYPVEINSEEQLGTIIEFIKDLGIDTFSGMVPLGYDYGCPSKECDHKYRSFSSEGQVDQTTTFFKYMDSTNFENDPENDVNANTDEQK